MSPTVARGHVYAACIVNPFRLWNVVYICSSSEIRSTSGSTAMSNFMVKECCRPLTVDNLCVWLDITPPPFEVCAHTRSVLLLRLLPSAIYAVSTDAITTKGLKGDMTLWWKLCVLQFQILCYLILQVFRSCRWRILLSDAGNFHILPHSCLQIKCTSNMAAWFYAQFKGVTSPHVSKGLIGRNVDTLIGREYTEPRVAIKAISFCYKPL